MLIPPSYLLCHKRFGGPIEDLKFIKTEIAPNSLGWLALARLTDSINSSKGTEKNQLYADVDGSGSDYRLVTAITKAISEAMERWAYYTCVNNEPSRYGLDIDSSSSGFAAYPKGKLRLAYLKSELEAVERWSLKNWWVGNFGCRRIHPGIDQVKGIEILQPMPNRSVVIVLKSIENLVAYGFAAGTSVNDARRGAIVELCRNINILRYYKSISNEPLTLAPSEKRMIYFANPKGYQEFESKVDSTLNSPNTFRNSHIESPLRYVIPGPWEKYAVVTRAVFPSSKCKESGPVEFNF